MLDDEVKALAKARNFAALTTLFADGRPQTSIMWVDADDDYVVVNTELHREKYKNVSADPRVNVVIMDSDDAHHYAEVRGRVVETEGGERAAAHLDELSMKYSGRAHRNPIFTERVILKIQPDRQRMHFIGSDVKKTS